MYNSTDSTELGGTGLPDFTWEDSGKVLSVKSNGTDAYLEWVRLPASKLYRHVLKDSTLLPYGSTIEIISSNSNAISSPALLQSYFNNSDFLICKVRGSGPMASIPNVVYIESSGGNVILYGAYIKSNNAQTSLALSGSGSFTDTVDLL